LADYESVASFSQWFSRIDTYHERMQGRPQSASGEVGMDILTCH